MINYCHSLIISIPLGKIYISINLVTRLSSLVVLIIPPLLRLLITLQNYQCMTRCRCHSVSHTLRINITRKLGPLSTPLARCSVTLQAKVRHPFSTRWNCSSAEITVHARKTLFTLKTLFTRKALFIREILRAQQLLLTCGLLLH